MEFKANTEDLVSVAEAAKVLKVARFTVYRWADKGVIHAVTLGHTKFIPTSEVNRLLKEQENKVAPVD
jgi:excisionase family DNA binding protein